LPSSPDLVIGCPQTTSSNGPGRIFFVFLNEDGEKVGWSELPNAGDKIATNISLIPYEQFGNALEGYQDLDENGIREVLVGAPRRPNENGVITGAFYILFPRRRRYFPGPFDWVRFYLIVLIPPAFFFAACCCGCVYFFWYFRRRPDPVEILVKKTGLDKAIDPSKPRNKYVKGNIVYIDEYTA
jgi:hypothetical protein